MPRSRRPTLILVAAALLTLMAVVTADTPVGAWGRVADTRSDNRLGEAQLEGKTFRVLWQCYYLPLGSPVVDLWQFLAGGELVGLRSHGTWEQNTPVSWKANIDECGGSEDFQGLILGPAILGFGTPEKVVVGIRVRR